MRLGLARKLVRRRQVTIGGLLVVVALSAGLLNWFRPITGAEAASIAERRFRAIPGAAEWGGRCRARPRFTDGGDGRNYWVVNIIATGTDEPLAQVSLD